MSHSVVLNWVASTDPVDGYNVYRGTNPPGSEGATPINSALLTVLTYTDTNVTGGEKVDYVVTSVKDGVESVHSNEVAVVIPPAAPTGLVAIAS